MPLVVNAKISADANNAVKVGSDGLLWAGAPRTWDSQPDVLIDNSWATPAQGQFAYQLGLNWQGATYTSYPLQTAIFQPFMVSRQCRFNGWSFYQYSQSSDSVMGYACSATYTSHPTTGLPATKI